MNATLDELVYGSLVKSSHISHRIIDELLSDCTSEELKALSEVIKTTKNILNTKAFTVSMATEDMVAACDYVGIVSANEVPDKFERAGFHATKSTYVNAPLINELLMALECKVKSFNDGILVGEIVNVTADESIVTNGKIDIKKLKPIAYNPANNTYLALGDVIGNAFAEGIKLK